MIITIPIKFSGSVVVEVLEDLTPEASRELAESLVLSRIVATMVNPDGPEDAGSAWDKSATLGICGSWDVLK